ncbi:MAG: helix-turn-helix domain-containing protein [Saccharofermentans sp.]|nr:helix-turn-helix domain-containing protein [Saccharofermentans sp.]
MDQKKIGRFLKTLRNEKGLTQEQLATHFHTTSRSVSRWETGSSLPDISLLVDLADFYDVDVRELIDGERITDMMDSEVREVADKMADYAGSEKNKLLRFIQIVGVLGVFGTLISLILQVISYQPDLKRALAILASFIGFVIMGIITLYVTGIIERIAKHKRFVKTAKIVTIVMLVIGVVQILKMIAAFGLVLAISLMSKIVVMTDVSEYEKYRQDPDTEYHLPISDMTEVLPYDISEEDVTDYQYTYYNPWDAQYILHMTVKYDDSSYEDEIARLEGIGVEEYKGIYSVTDEPSGYDLVAMDSDSYNGFVYAMVPEDQDGTITYVMICFCNYFLDLDIHEYMPDELLLQGFNAADDNPDQLAFQERAKNKDQDS